MSLIPTLYQQSRDTTIRFITAFEQSVLISVRLAEECFPISLAGKVQMGGKNVSKEDIENTRTQEESDVDIHNIVLIAAAFCLFNRYVDGLATRAR